MNVLLMCFHLQVSAALAARASAESGRHALKMSQQLRLAHSSSAFKGERSGREKMNESRSETDFSSNHGNADSSQGGNSIIEDTIMRAQKVLNRRSQQNSIPNPNPNPAPRSVEERRDSFDGRRSSETPTSAKSQRLNDVIQLANHLYGTCCYTLL